MKKLDRFLLRDTISDGPAGTVYRAEEILPGDNRRTVALKVLPPAEPGQPTGESETEQRFFGEVRVLAQLAVHPHIVTIYAMGLTDGHPWLAMEYTPQTLAWKLGETPIDPRLILRMMDHVGRGLMAMHALKPPLIHQDLKPSNILLDALGNHKITDFSLSTVTAAHKTHALATVRYAAPEMLSAEFGKVGPATDLYALGHIAYEMALGSRSLRSQFPAVYEGNTTKEPPPNKWMMWHASAGIRPAPVAEVVRGFPPMFSEIIARLMAKNSEERYNSAEDLLRDIGAARQEAAQGAATRAAAPPMPAAPAPAPPTPRAIPAPIALAPVPTPKPPAPAQTSTGPQYWVRLRGKVTGPFDLAALQRQVKQGQLSRLHQISSDQATWKQASEMEGLYGPSIVG